VQKRLGAGRSLGDVSSLADMPIGFQARLNEQHPTDDTKLFISTYHNCWITRYTRPIVSSGDLLTIEAAVMPGKGNIIRTGQLGDVMKESVEAARSVVRSRARRLGIKDEMFEKRDIHIHVPDGATPKDGPSAGAAMTTAFVSALTGIPVRADVAMTGEITLRGEVLPIGGLKEKLLAAHRGGITQVLIPIDNEKDLAEIPDNIKGNLDIKPVKWIDEVLELALTHQPTPNIVAGAAPVRAVDKKAVRRGRRASKQVQAH
jgi:ATP-dependent Lon protease